MSEFDVPDPDRLREAAAATTAEDMLVNAQALLYLIEQSEDGRLVIPAEAMARYASGESGKAILVREAGDEVIFTAVDDPPSATAHAILEGGADWVRAESGQAVKVTGADGDTVFFVVELVPGGWSLPEGYQSERFLRDHVLAAGVPLLGGDHE